MASRKQHKYKIGSLVELKNGVRMFIHALRWDCDGTPLYNFVALDEDIEREDDMYFSSVCGLDEDFIVGIVRDAEVVE